MCVCVCVLFCAEASFLDERPLTTPSLFLPHFPLDLSSTDPFFLPTHPTPPPPPFIFFVCSLFSLSFFMLPSILGFFSPSSDLSHSPTVHTRAVGATAAFSNTIMADTNDRFNQERLDVFFFSFSFFIKTFFFLSFFAFFCGQATLAESCRMEFQRALIHFQVFFLRLESTLNLCRSN